MNILLRLAVICVVLFGIGGAVYIVFDKSCATMGDKMPWVAGLPICSLAIGSLLLIDKKSQSK